MTTESVRNDLPDGIKVPGVRALLDVRAMLNEINSHLPGDVAPYASCRIANLRYKTPTSCLVSYALHRDANGNDSETTYVYARGSSEEAFGSARDKLTTDRWIPSEDGPGVVAVPKHHAILYWYPNDERLSGLRRITVSKKLQRLFYAHLEKYPESEWRVSNRSIRRVVVRYKPERRAVMRCRFRAHRHKDNFKEERFVYLGLYEEARAVSIWKIISKLTALAAASTHWTVPQPLAYVSEHSMIITDEMPGEALSQVIANGSHGAIGSAMERTATAIAELHSVQTDVIPYAGPDVIAAQITTSVNMIGRMAPEQAGQAQAIGARLETAIAGVHGRQSDFVHGDLHPRQILLGDMRTGILDIDRAHRGDAMLDLGNFRAQLWLNNRQDNSARGKDLSEQFLSAYTRVSGQEISRRALDVWTAYALFRSALIPLGRFEPDWRAQTHELMAATENLLQ